MTTLWANPGGDTLIAGVASSSANGLWSGSGNGSWQELGTGAGSTPIVNRPASIVYDPTNSSRYWESGIYGTGAGVYETTNNGETFTAPGGDSTYHCDLVSVDFTDPMRQTLLAGGHEEVQTLRLSTAGGTTWTNIGGSLPNDTNCTLPLIIDKTTYLVGCNYYQGPPNGVYRTIDSGKTWTQVSKSGGSSAPLVAGGAIYWASPGAAGGMTRSTDNGETWKEIVGPGVVANVHPIELPGGRLATIGGQLYGTQYVLVSSDQGTTWIPATSAVPVSNAGVAFLSQDNRFYVWTSTCSSGQLDVVMRFDPANPDR